MHTPIGWDNRGPTRDNHKPLWSPGKKLQGVDYWNNSYGSQLTPALVYKFIKKQKAWAKLFLNATYMSQVPSEPSILIKEDFCENQNPCSLAAEELMNLQ